MKSDVIKFPSIFDMDFTKSENKSIILTLIILEPTKWFCIDS